MVLTKEELIGSMQNEVRILLHLATKIDRDHLDYRPTPKQRSTIELLRYLAMMGPALIQSEKGGAFDPATWTATQKALEGKTFDQVIDAIAATADQYTALLGDMSDADFRKDVEMFGRKSTCGSFIVNTVEEKRVAVRDSYAIRRAALQERVTLITTLDGARAACTGMEHAEELRAYVMQGLHAKLSVAA